MTKACTSVVVPKRSRMMVTVHSAITPRATSFDGFLDSLAASGAGLTSGVLFSATRGFERLTDYYCSLSDRLSTRWRGVRRKENPRLGLRIGGSGPGPLLAVAARNALCGVGTRNLKSPVIERSLPASNPRIGLNRVRHKLFGTPNRGD